MAGRYFLLAGASDDARRGVRRGAAQDPALDIALDTPGLIVVVASGTSMIPLGDAGLILGALRTRRRRARVEQIEREAATSILGDRGDHLSHAYWGDYVAILRRPLSHEITIIRAPLGGLPCLRVATPDGTAIASDVRLLERLGGYQPRVNWDAVARFAAAPDVRLPETCLTGVTEIQGGTSCVVGIGEPVCATLWSPWTFAQPGSAILDPAEAARRLRDTIATAAAAMTGEEAHSLILLSGGLDSSIVAAGIAASGAKATCVTISTRAASGDEREFASAAAGKVGLALIERRFELDGVDLERSDAAHCPRPVARAFEVEGRRQSKTVASELGATSIFSGGGGDNIFCSLQSVAPAVDCLDHADGRDQFWRVAHDLSRMTGASLFTIARKAWLRSFQRTRQYPRPFEVQFLAPHSAEQAASAPLHPWLRRRAPVLQGKGAHVAAMLGVQSLTEDNDALDPLGLRYPLLAQPVVELCLRIPTWLWYDRGCNRAVARRGFSHDLPEQIAWRRSKGTPDSFVVEIYDARRDQIRAMLSSGNLAKHGLLDLSALLPVLDDRRPVRGSDHGRIMRLVDIEAWTRCWVT